MKEVGKSVLMGGMKLYEDDGEKEKVRAKVEKGNKQLKLNEEEMEMKGTRECFQSEIGSLSVSIEIFYNFSHEMWNCVKCFEETAEYIGYTEQIIAITAETENGRDRYSLYVTKGKIIFGVFWVNLTDWINTPNYVSSNFSLATSHWRLYWTLKKLGILDGKKKHSLPKK